MIPFVCRFFNRVTKIWLDLVYGGSDILDVEDLPVADGQYVVPPPHCELISIVLMHDL